MHSSFFSARLHPNECNIIVPLLFWHKFLKKLFCRNFEILFIISAKKQSKRTKLFNIIDKTLVIILYDHYL
jgi:hypothetical protein